MPSAPSSSIALKSSPPEKDMRLFVYGTLMRGESNHRYLKSARFERAAATRAEFALADFGDYPAIVRPGSCAITGELYEIDEATLARVDELEEVPEFYERCEIVLEGGVFSGEGNAIWPPSAKETRIWPPNWRVPSGATRTRSATMARAASLMTLIIS